MTFETSVTKSQIREGGVTFTICTGRDEFYTFNVSRDDTTPPPVWIVRLMAGPPRCVDHTLLGCLDFGWGGMNPPTVSVEPNTPGDVFNQAMRLIWKGSDHGE